MLNIYQKITSRKVNNPFNNSNPSLNHSPRKKNYKCYKQTNKINNNKYQNNNNEKN